MASTALSGLVLIGGMAGLSHANPAGGTVVAGSATISQPSSSYTQVDQSTQRAIINWQSFSIGSGQQTRVNQPNASSWQLERVVGGDPSVIAGRLSSNGNLAIVNGSGVVFSQGSQVDVNGLIATTADIHNEDFMAGKLNFSIPSANPNATVVNEGQISIADHGLAALVAPGVANSGIIRAKFGKVMLAGAETFTVDFYGDGLISFDVGSKVTQAPVGPDGKPMTALVTNTGQIEADGGTILLTADAADNILTDLVHAGGVLQAQSVGAQTGQVTIDGGSSAQGTVLVTGTIDASGRNAGETGGSVSVRGDQVGLLTGASIDVSGDAGGGNVAIGGTFHGADGHNSTATVVQKGVTIRANAITKGNGGQVAVWSNGYTNFNGRIYAKGGAQGGHGGNAETSGKSILDVGDSAVVDLSAPAGTAGSWLLDPDSDLAIDNKDNNSTNTGGKSNPDIFTPTADDSEVNANTIVNDLNKGTSVTISTSNPTGTQPGNIAVTSAIAKTKGGDATLSLDAGAGGGSGTITISADITSTAGALNVDLEAPNSSSAVTLGANINTNGGTLTIVSATGINQTAGTLTVGGSTSLATTQVGSTISLAQTNAISGPLTLNTAGDATVKNSAGTTLAASTINGNLTLEDTTGGFTQTGALTVTGTSSFTTDAAGQAIVLNTQTNQLVGAVTLDTQSGVGSDASLLNSGGTNLNTSDVGGNLSVTDSSASISQSGVLTVGGTSSFTTQANAQTIALNTQINALTGAVSLNTQSGAGNNASLKNGVATTGTVLGASSVGGNLSIEETTAGISQTGGVQVTGTSSFQTDTAGQTINLATATNALGGGTQAITFATNGTGNAVSLKNSGGTLLPGTTITGTLSVEDTTGSIAETAALTVTGGSSFTTDGTGASINLATATNVLGTSVSLKTATGTGDTASLKNSGGTVLATSTVGDTLSVEDTTGGISQSGVVTAHDASGGTSLFQTDAAAQAIALSTQTNAITGPASLNTLGGGTGSTVSLKNSGGTTLATSTIGDTLTVEDTTGGISQTGVVTVQSASGGTSSFQTDATGQSIVLNTQTNAITGLVSLNTASGTGSSASLKNSGGTILAASTVGDTLSVEDTSGGIAQTAVLTVHDASGGASLFQTDATSQAIALNTQTNAITGPVSLNTGSGTGSRVSLKNSGGTALATSTIGDTLTVEDTTGAISQTGALTLHDASGGTSTFQADAAGQAITLTNSGNAIASPVTFTTDNGNVALVDSAALTVAGGTVGTGTLSLAAPGVTITGTVTSDTSTTIAAFGPGTAWIVGDNTTDTFAPGGTPQLISDASIANIQGGGALTLASNIGADLFVNLNTPPNLATPGYGNLTLTGDHNLNLDSNVAAGTTGNLILNATNGAILQNAGNLNATTLTATANGAAGSIALAGATSTNDVAGLVTLNATGNASFTNSVALDVAGTVGGLATLNAPSISFGTISAGSLGATALTGSISETGPVTVTGASSFQTKTAGQTITLTNNGNDLIGTATLTTAGAADSATVTNSVALSVAGTVGGLATLNAPSIRFATFSAGSIGATATTGGISQTGAVQVVGGSTLITDAAGQAITLTNNGNAFENLVTFLTTNGNVALVDSVPLTVNIGTVGTGTLALTAPGVTLLGAVTSDTSTTITALGGTAWIVGGTPDTFAPGGTPLLVSDTSLANLQGGGALTLASNVGADLFVNLNTPPNLPTPGYGNLTLTADHNLNLDSNVAAGTTGNLFLNATNGAILQNAGNLAATNLTATATGAAGAITLTSATNDITGSETLTTGANANFANSVTLDVAGTVAGLATFTGPSISFGTFSAGSLAATATTGSISDTGPVTVTGASSLQTNTAGQTITLTNNANDFVGTVTLNTSGAAGNASVTNSVALGVAGTVGGLATLNAPSISFGTFSAGSLGATASTGGISQTGAVTVTGTSSLQTVAAGQAIALTNAANAFESPVTFTTDNGNVALVDGVPLTIAGGTVGTGTLSLTAPGVTIAGIVTSDTSTTIAALGPSTAWIVGVTPDLFAPGGTPLLVSNTSLANLQGGGALTIASTSGADLFVNLINSAGFGDLTLTADHNLNIDGVLAAGTTGNLILNATNGAILQNAGGLIATNLTANATGAAGSITLTSATNDVTGAVTLTTSGAASLTNGVDTTLAPSAAGTLTINDAGHKLTLGSVATNGAQSYTAATVQLQGASYTTNGATFTITGDTVLGNALATIDTTNSGVSPLGANVTFANGAGSGRIDGTAPGAQSLSINAGTAGTIEIGGYVGNSVALGAVTLRDATLKLDVDATAGLNDEKVLTSGGSFSETGSTQLGNGGIGTITIDTTDGGALPSGANVTFAGTVDGVEALTVQAGTGGAAVFNGPVGSNTLLLSLTTTAGSTDLNGGSITTFGAQTYNGAVVLGATDTLTSVFSGNVTFTSTVNGPFALTVNTAGVTTFGGTVGGTTPLTSLTTDAPGSTDLASSITTTGAQTYNDAVTLAGNTALTSTGGGNITLGGTVNGPFSLTLTTAGVTAFGGAVGGTTALASLTADASAIDLNGGSITTTGAQTYVDPVVLSTAETLTSTGGGNITFASTVNGAFDLTVNTAGVATFGGAVGGTTALASLTRNAAGSTDLASSITTTGAQAYNDAVVLSANTVLTSTGGGNIALGGTVDGAFGLAVNTAGVTTFGGAIGATTPLRSVTTDAPGLTNLAGTVTTTGAQMFNDAVFLGSNTVLTSTGAGNITFASTVDGPAGLTVNTAGAATFAGAVGGTTALANVTTEGGGSTNLNAGTVTTTGAQAFDDAIVLGVNTTLISIGGGNITLASELDGPAGLTVSTAGAVTFGGAVGAAQPLGGLAATGGSISFAGPVDVSGNLSLDATSGNISQNAPFTVGGTSVFAADAANTAITLTNAGNVLLGAVTLQTAGNASLTNDVSTTLASASSGGTLTVTVEAGNLTVAGNIAASKASLNAAGTVNQTGGIIAAGNLSGSSVGGASFTKANQVASFGSFTNAGSGDLTFVDAVSFSTTGTLSSFGSVFLTGPGINLGGNANAGGMISVASSGALTTNGSIQMGAGTLIKLGGTTFTQTGTLTITPSTPVFEVETGPGLTQANLGCNECRIPQDVIPFANIGNDNAFGPINFQNLAASQTNVLIWAGAATVSGNINVKGLGISGTGGSAALTGTVGGVTSIAAANLAIKGPKPDNAYRINDCAIGTPNCIVLPQIVPVIPTPNNLINLLETAAPTDPLDIERLDTGSEDSL